jgi:hypothetical protein
MLTGLVASARVSILPEGESTNKPRNFDLRCILHSREDAPFLVSVAKPFEFSFGVAFGRDLGDVDHAAGLDGLVDQLVDGLGGYDVGGAHAYRWDGVLAYGAVEGGGATPQQSGCFPDRVEERCVCVVASVGHVSPVSTCRNGEAPI